MKLLPALPFDAHHAHEEAAAGTKAKADIKSLYPTTSHVMSVEISKSSPDAVDSAGLQRTLVQKVQDYFREASLPLHGIVPFHQGHDPVTGTSFVRAYLTFPTPAIAHQSALILQQHVNAASKDGTIKVLPRKPHGLESTAGERFHPNLLTV